MSVKALIQEYFEQVNCQNCLHCKTVPGKRGRKYKKRYVPEIRFMKCSQEMWLDHNGADKTVAYYPGRWNTAEFLSKTAENCSFYEPM